MSNFNFTIPDGRYEIANEPGYYVEKDGSIWSCLEYRGFQWRRLEPTYTEGAGCLVGINGNVRQVHRLVLETFVGKRPYGAICRHLDGNKKNNRLDNLEWVQKNLEIGTRSAHNQGYIKVMVGKDHHLADQHGWALEHRVVAEQKLGRRLADGEHVHHINENRADNRPENLQVVLGNREHKIFHRKRTDLRGLDEDNPEIPCGCGCGETLLKYDSGGRPRKHIRGHSLYAHSRFTDEDIRKIRELRAAGIATREVGKMFNLDSGMVSRIANRKVWKHVT